jgi:methylornithine synthase
MASPGALPHEMFAKVRDAGADWYACYQETYNRELFESLRLNQSFDDRRNQKTWAMEAGLLAEDGMMIGLGETVRDRAETISTMSSLGCGQVRAMTFVPQVGTPMQDFTPYDSTEELKAIAIMRLLNQDKLIPCSLDVEGVAGLKKRINAGANVVTSIVPPSKHLAGVAQHELDIENGNRSVEHVFELLEDMGHHHASSAEYRAYLDAHRPKRVV